jgi:hypothetical protein
MSFPNIKKVVLIISSILFLQIMSKDARAQDQILEYTYPYISDSLDAWIFKHQGENYLRRIIFNDSDSKGKVLRVIGNEDLLDLMYEHLNLEWVLDNLPTTNELDRDTYLKGLLFQIDFPFNEQLWRDKYGVKKFDNKMRSSAKELIKQEHILDSLEYILKLKNEIDSIYIRAKTARKSWRVSFLDSINNRDSIIPKEEMSIINYDHSPLIKRHGFWKHWMGEEDINKSQFVGPWLNIVESRFVAEFLPEIRKIGNIQNRLEERYLVEYLREYKYYYCEALISEGVILSYSKQEDQSFEEGNIDLIRIINDYK